MYHCSVVTHIGQENYVYTNLCNISETYKIKDVKIPRNKPIMVLDYWSNNIEEDFHLRNPDNINLSDKSTTQGVKNVMNNMVIHVKSMEQGMMEPQDKPLNQIMRA